MNIDRLQFREYSLPLKEPIRTAKGTIAERRGFLIWLWDREGRYGVGEAAPLPPFSTETMEDVAGQLQQIARQVQEHTPLLSADGSRVSFQELPGATAPSVRFALSIALLDLQGKQTGQTARQLLAGTTADTLALNGLISLMPPEECSRQAARLVNEGFSTLKVKLGHPSPEEDLRCVEAVAGSVGPGILLRLDPNEAWDFETTVRLGPRLAEFSIEYLEQPLRFESIDSLRTLRESCPIPMALDTLSVGLRDIRTIMTTRLANAVILKPTMLGSLSQITDIVDLTRKRQVKTVFTSTFESVVGLAGVAQVAAVLAPDVTHGLATGDLFARKYLSDHPYRTANGRLQLPTGAGLSLDVAPEELAATP